MLYTLCVAYIGNKKKGRIVEGRGGEGEGKEEERGGEAFYSMLWAWFVNPNTFLHVIGPLLLKYIEKSD